MVMFVDGCVETATVVVRWPYRSLITDWIWAARAHAISAGSRSRSPSRTPSETTTNGREDPGAAGFPVLRREFVVHIGSTAGREADSDDDPVDR